VQWVGRGLALSDDQLRLAGLSSIVLANLGMLAWYRSGRSASGRNRVFDGLLVGVCVLFGLILLLQPLATAFGLPPRLDARWVVLILAVPAVWSLWRMARR
jgi:Ca2+-transporting ATPase